MTLFEDVDNLGKEVRAKKDANKAAEHTAEKAKEAARAEQKQQEKKGPTPGFL